jgi:hypothetical protein
MSRVDPATSHRRLQSVRFLSADIDRELYADLKNRVLGLLGSDEKIELPDVNAPHAWSRTFSVYQKLQARLDRETAANEQQANIAGATELRWNEFVSVRGQILDYLAHQYVNHDVREFCALLDSDLVDPIDRSEEGEKQGYPRRRDWPAVADRLNSAWHKLRTLTSEQRRTIPDILERRRLAERLERVIEAVNLMNERLNTFTHKFEWLDERISSVESKFISNKH